MEKLGLDFGETISEKINGVREYMPGAVETIKLLKKAKFGANVFIVSKVNEQQKQDVLHFIDRADLCGTLDIPRDHIFFCELRPEKAPICEKLGITHFVDDRIEVLSYMKTVGTRIAINPKDMQFWYEGARIARNWEDIRLMILGR